jgi:uncharacterized protein (DUF952 family)
MSENDRIEDTMNLLDELSKINQTIEEGLKIDLSDPDFADGRDELLHIFLHEACHAAVAHCVPWVHDLEEKEHTAVDELLARFLEVKFGKALDLFVHSNAEFVEELSYYPVAIELNTLEHLIDIWDTVFWPRKDLPGMAEYTLNVLRYQQVFYHILPAADWATAQAAGVYSPASLDTEGFIHCSRIDQVERTLAVHFKGQEGLLVLSIAVPKVEAEIRDEDLYDAGQTFPHIYGSLNLDAVVGVTEVIKNEDGKISFTRTNNIG